MNCVIEMPDLPVYVFEAYPFIGIVLLHYVLWVKLNYMCIKTTIEGNISLFQSKKINAELQPIHKDAKNV